MPETGWFKDFNMLLGDIIQPTTISNLNYICKIFFFFCHKILHNYWSNTGAEVLEVILKQLLSFSFLLVLIYQSIFQDKKQYSRIQRMSSSNHVGS